MYTFISSLTSKEFFLKQLPVFSLSFLTAELFYKFHSFILECSAFLLTWYLLDALMHLANTYLNHQVKRD